MAADMVGMTAPRRKTRFKDTAEDFRQATIDYLTPKMGRRPTTAEIGAAWLAWLAQYEEN